MYTSRSLRCPRPNLLTMRKILFTLSVLFMSAVAGAQTATSLFWKTDSLQINEIVSDVPELIHEVGHQGPAVENSHMILSMCFDNSGAIDLYSKSGRGMELRRYLFNSTADQRENEGAGADAYVVGETLGCGGFALWDGEKMVKLAATKGRTVRVGQTKKGSYAEMIAYGVAYKDGYVDVSVRIDVVDKVRTATLTASELSGKKVQFVTGVNFHEGQKTFFGNDHVAAWGIHPSSEVKLPVGVAVLFSAKDFPVVEKDGDMLIAISQPMAKVKTEILAASTKEAELNSAKRFEEYVVD